jgi:hypothetical protein
MKAEELENLFTYHAPIGSQQDRYIRIRAMAFDLATTINHACPESREKSLAITSVQQAAMWANAAIAINEKS